MADVEATPVQFDAQGTDDVANETGLGALDAGTAANDVAAPQSDLQDPAAADAGAVTGEPAVDVSEDAQAASLDPVVPERSPSTAPGEAVESNPVVDDPTAADSSTLADDSTPTAVPVADEAEQEQQPEQPEQQGREENLTAEAVGTDASPGKVAAAKAAFLNPAEACTAVNVAASVPTVDYEDEKPSIKVRELREQLSLSHPYLTGGSRPPSHDGSKERPERSPSPLISEHDKVNTANVAELLKTAEYKKVPGVDMVPYDELINLRLEDGIDVTRKEEYLSPDDFHRMMGMDKAAFSKLPQWKRLQLKRDKKLF